MIFDLEKMKSCNEKWIFYNDDTSRKITPDMVPEVLRYLTGELAYYSRVYDDFKKRYDSTIEKVHALPIPDPKYFEYQAAMKYDCMECVNAERLHQRRMALWSEADTYAIVYNDSFDKCTHYKKCLYLLTGSRW